MYKSLAVNYIFNFLCAFNFLQPMKKFVFSVASFVQSHWSVTNLAEWLWGRECRRRQTQESLSNSRRRRRSGRPEVKMHYWRLLRMRKTKLESSFSSGRLATRVSEVVFGRWVFIHFFCLLSNMPWKHNHISVFLMIFWNQRYLSDSGWRNWSCLLIEELSPLL